MNITTTLSYTLSNLANVFRTNLEFSMNEIGLHGGQVFVLISLWQEDNQNQVSLARSLNLATPTINKMVKNLTEQGFISCQKCGGDGRMVRVKLTAKGRECERSVLEQWRKVEEATFSQLTETEKIIFSQLLIKLKDSIVKSSGGKAA